MSFCRFQGSVRIPFGMHRNQEWWEFYIPVLLPSMEWRVDLIPEIEDGFHGMSSWNHNSTLIPYHFLGGIFME
jgi:hypothetical protein